MKISPCTLLENEILSQVVPFLRAGHKYNIIVMKYIATSTINCGRKILLWSFVFEVTSICFDKSFEDVSHLHLLLNRAKVRDCQYIEGDCILSKATKEQLQWQI